VPAAIPNDPFENTSPESTAKFPLLDIFKKLSTDPRPASEWETLIIRGKTSETRTFPMPGKDAEAETSKSEPEPAAVGAGA
jgi:hypothetical protein